jgi:hypothetical protein
METSRNEYDDDNDGKNISTTIVFAELESLNQQNKHGRLRTVFGSALCEFADILSWHPVYCTLQLQMQQRIQNIYNGTMNTGYSGLLLLQEDIRLCKLE